MEYQTYKNNASILRNRFVPKPGKKPASVEKTGVKQKFFCFTGFFKAFKKRIAPGTHEKKVENFYSTGINRARLDHEKIDKIDRGFLSFGYWDKETTSYLEAATNLVNFVIKNSNLKKKKRILNVACGYGTETFSFYDRFAPELIEGIEITKIHVDIANTKARELGLSEKIKFRYGDACEPGYPDESFSCILGIEGPAHFNSREKFFETAFRVLENEGELLMTDIILGKEFNNGEKLQILILKCVAKLWVYPKVNWVDEEAYKSQLEKAGLKLNRFKKIGDRVFPGFAGNCFKIKTIKTRSAHRGFLSIIGLNIISFLLKYVYKKGLIEYIFVRAQKGGGAPSP